MPPKKSKSAPTRSRASIALSPLDRTRYFDYRAGISPAELAARENVQLDTIEKSITKMRSHLAAHSQESVELATREIYLNRLPDANLVFQEALTATIKQTRIEQQERWNTITEQYDTVDVTVETDVADHATRLKATETLKSLLASTIPKTPMVAVDARSQTVNMPGGAGGAGLAAGQQQGLLGSGALSAEAIIRQIRASRGELTAGMPDAPALTAAPPPVEVDYELQAELAEDGELDEVDEVGKADKLEIKSDLAEGEPV